MKIDFVGKSFEIMARALAMIGAGRPVRHTSDYAVKMLTRAADKGRVRPSRYNGAALREIRARNGVGRPPAVNLARLKP